MNIDIDWHIENSAFAQRVYAVLVNLAPEAQKSIDRVEMKRTGKDSRNPDEMTIVFHAVKNTWLSLAVKTRFFEMLGKAGVYVFDIEQDENFQHFKVYMECPEKSFRDQDKADENEYKLQLFVNHRRCIDEGAIDNAKLLEEQIDRFYPRHKGEERP